MNVRPKLKIRQRMTRTQQRIIRELAADDSVGWKDISKRSRVSVVGCKAYCKREGIEYVPKAIEKTGRNRKVYSARQAGALWSELEEEFGLSCSTLRRIYAREAAKLGEE